MTEKQDRGLRYFKNAFIQQFKEMDRVGNISWRINYLNLIEGIIKKDMTPRFRAGFQN